MFKKISSLIILCSVCSVAQIEQNLLLHYSFDGNTEDQSVNAYHGNPSGISFGEDRHGNPNSAVYFDGIDDFIDFPNITELKPDFPMSFAFWIKYESSAVEDREVFDTSFQDDFSSGISFNSENSTGRYAVNYGDGSSVYNSGTRRTFVSNQMIEVDVWRHVVVVLKSSIEIKIYIDCVEYPGIYSGSGGPLQYSSNAGSIGRHDRDLGALPLYFKGALDDFRYWDREVFLEEFAHYCDNLGLEESQIKKIVIHPNPAKNRINIDSNGHIIESYKIFNPFGQLIQSSNFKSTIYLGDLSEGLYYLQLQGENSTIIHKILIQK